MLAYMYISHRPLYSVPSPTGSKPYASATKLHLLSYKASSFVLQKSSSGNAKPLKM